MIAKRGYDRASSLKVTGRIPETAKLGLRTDRCTYTPVNLLHNNMSTNGTIMIRSLTKMPKLLVVAANARLKIVEYTRTNPTNGCRQLRKAAASARRRFHANHNSPNASRQATAAMPLCTSQGNGRNIRNGDSARRSGNGWSELKTEPPICVLLVKRSALSRVPC